MRKLQPSGETFNPNTEIAGLIGKIYNLIWALIFYINNYKPTSKVFRFGGGLGDHLLISSVFQEFYKRSIHSNWILSDYPDIFIHNKAVSRVIPDNWRVIKFCEKFNCTPITLSYGTWIDDSDRIAPPEKHIIAEILERAGLTGDVVLRPYYPAVETRNPEDHVLSTTVCIQGSNTSSTTPMLNKQWAADKFAEVGQALGTKFRLVQLGLPGESDIPGAEDLRGKLSIPEAAEMLAKCRFFIGQVGFLMHLARAVGTRSVVIFGGREKAWQSGYPCNENLETNPECSPCWRNDGCEYNRKCLSDITVQAVLDAVERLESRLGQPLETETAVLA